MDVAEIYSPPRVTGYAKEFDLEGGWSLDLTTCDTDGEPWDFNRTEMRNRAIRNVLNDKPTLVIGSPMCTDFSSLMNWNWKRMNPVEAQERWSRSVSHLNFCATIYKMQMGAGRYFVHEHPLSATSWKQPCMQELQRDERVIKTRANMCAYGMTTRRGEEVSLASKPTSFMTNSPCIAEELNKRCENYNSPKQQWHKHITLVNGRAKAAQVYPKGLCRAICSGLNRQKKIDEAMIFMIGSLELKNGEEAVEELREAKGASTRAHEPDDESQFNDYQYAYAYDDVTREPLEVWRVVQARKEEMAYFKKMRVYKKVPISRCYQMTGKAPIGVRWVDVNKQDDINPKYRSRLVAKQFKRGNDPD
eukprot:8652733-Karenia_brevis.AAC.1